MIPLTAVRGRAGYGCGTAKLYSTRGARALLARYAAAAGLPHNMPRTGCGTCCSPG